ncbi:MULTISPECIES: hypothetical protein [Kitasatospora]|uniref:Uncharacterized protein n=1 Tax=Kitasatospora cystarginea TaxID=58350 RepID=A0ABP5RTQ2_9ACTN
MINVGASHASVSGPRSCHRRRESGVPPWPRTPYPAHRLRLRPHPGGVGGCEVHGDRRRRGPDAASGRRLEDLERTLAWWHTAGEPGVERRQALDELLHAAGVLTIRRRELAERLLAAHPAQAARTWRYLPGARRFTPRGEQMPGRIPIRPLGWPYCPRPVMPRPTLDRPPLRPEEKRPRLQPPFRPPTRSARNPLFLGEKRRPPPRPTPPILLPLGGHPPTPTGDGARLRELVDLHLAQQTAPGPDPTAAPKTPKPSVTEDTAPADPRLRGLPDTDVCIGLDYRVFGDYWSLAGWTVNPDVYLVLGEGHQVGWAERGLPGIGDRA